jgi:tRNA1(Val) A37 N6-methylase TrmN6
VNIKDIKGLKYPDEYFIKFFFKYGLHLKKDTIFLELGCSNGCNLMLPYQFANSVIGVDLDKNLIQYANDNFKQLRQNNIFDFFSLDMRYFCDTSSNINADVLILANSIYYITKDEFVKMLRNIKKNNLIKSNIPFFIRFRQLDDFRNNKGEKVGKNSIIIENKITNEDGVFCRFYDTFEMIDILKNELNLRDFEFLNIRYDNIQNNTKVNNSDVVIWGIVN